jgi:hypothetical protein
MIVVVVSDNGASGQGGPNGSVNEMKIANDVPDRIEDNLAMLDKLGSRLSRISALRCRFGNRTP